MNSIKYKWLKMIGIYQRLLMLQLYKQFIMMLHSRYLTPIMYVDISGYFWDTVLDVVSIVWSLNDFIKDPSWKNLVG